MPTNVLMPQLGESITEGTVVRWNKEVGDLVDRDEPLFEISTDKVDAEIPSPAGGVVMEVRVQAGETVAVDSIVAIIGAPGSAVTDDAAPPPTTLSGSTPGSGGAPLRVPRSDRRAGLSPVVRRLAREHGVDPADVAGTGAGGRVTKADILQYVESTGVSAPDTARVEPLSVMRRRIAEHMVLSRRTSAHVHTVFDVDFGRVSALRREDKDTHERAGGKLTYLSFVAKAVVGALAEMPVLNASLSGGGTDVVYTPDVNLGIAVALDDDQGLIVPVIRNAGEKSLTELSRAIVDIADRARNKRLVPDDVQGGTFTITNPGAYGSIFGMPIINQPQVAILCVGAVEQRPTVVDDTGTIQVRPRCYLTLGFDHRLIDGAVADRFMAKVKAGLENFDAALL